MRTTLFAAMFAMVASGCGPDAGSGGQGGGGTPPNLTSITVLPAAATVAVENGAAAPGLVTYSAVGKFSDGHEEALPQATFALDGAAGVLGQLNGANFVAGGKAAGTGLVQATVGDLSGNTTVSVTVHTVRLGGGVPPDAGMKFNGPATANGAFSPTIVYPLDGAIMPSTVKAPDVQWEGASAAGDLYRVKMVAGAATIETILQIDTGFTYDNKPAAEDWATLVASANNQPIVTTVDHWDATNGVHASSPVSVKPVNAIVTGAIYYWDLSDGKLLRIDDAGRAPAIPSPPPMPQDPNNKCVACHVVSRDGRFLAAELWGGSQPGGVFDLASASIMGSPAPTMNPIGSYVSLFSTFNPDASRLLINYGNALGLVNPKTGTAVPVLGTQLPTTQAAHPTWSPDGSLIAFIDHTDSTSWAVDYTAGDVSVIPVTGPDTFGAPQVLVQNTAGAANYKAPSWPSFTPDSQFIAYAAGVNSRGRNGANTYPGSLFMVSRNGGAPTRLDTACANLAQCYLPNVGPYDAGGYFWMIFYSFQNYGNAQAGTKGTARRQLWVTAIDKSKLGSGDPSSVPYWLPDQDAKTDNMSAFWSLPPPVQ